MAIRWNAALLAAALTLSATGCGGGGGSGGDTAPQPAPEEPGTDPTPTPDPGTDPTPDPGTEPAPLRLGNIVFSRDASTVAALVAAADAADPTLVLMRQAGLAQRLTAILADGRPLSTELDAEGRLTDLELAGYRFSLDYAESTATLTYQLPDAAPQSMPFDAGLCSATPAAGTTVAAGLGALLDWYAEARYACLIDQLDSAVGQSLAGPLQQLGQYAERLRQARFELDYTVKNRVVCANLMTQCAVQLGPHARELIDGLRAIDPQGKTEAGFTVSELGVRLIRSEWDPLILDGTVDPALGRGELPCERSIFAEADARCPAQYVPPSLSSLYPYGDSFVVDGITYHTGPVLLEQITGFAWPIAGGMGINDGEAGGARVWYGTNSCMTFRIDGSGVQDMKGGTTTTIDSFPWLDLRFEPGTWSAAFPTMRGFARPIRGILDPSYDRRSELRSFRWGVRLNADGSVYRDVRGHYEFYLKFEDGSALRAAWDPAANGPASDYSNALRGFTNAVPTSHFCYFREATSVQLEPYCPETPTTNPVNGRRKLCYFKGQLNGEYQLWDQYDRTLEEGRFENNRPVGGWFFSRDDGTPYANGSFAENGLQTGEWTYYDANGSRSETVPFTGGTWLYEPWNAYLRTVTGRYTKYENGLPSQEGSLWEGHENGWWYSYRGSVRAEGREYDANTQIATGASTCYNNDCLKHTRSWLKTFQTYIWSACGVSTPWVREVRYNYDGSPAATTCYQLNGTPQEPEIGAELPHCPRPCA